MENRVVAVLVIHKWTCVYTALSIGLHSFEDVINILVSLFAANLIQNYQLCVKFMLKLITVFYQLKRNK